MYVCGVVESQPGSVTGIVGKHCSSLCWRHLDVVRRTCVDTYWQNKSTWRQALPPAKSWRWKSISTSNDAGNACRCGTWRASRGRSGALRGARAAGKLAPLGLHPRRLRPRSVSPCRLAIGTASVWNKKKKKRSRSIYTSSDPGSVRAVSPARTEVGSRTRINGP